MIGYLRDYADKLENIGDQPELSRILGELITSFSRGATKVVAASDSLESSKQAADYVCDGVDDHVQIQAAIDALPNGKGTIVFSEGAFYPSNSVTITNKNQFSLSFLGSHIYPATDTFPVLVLNGCDYFSIEGQFIISYGPATSNTPSTDTEAVGIRLLGDSFNFTIKDNHVIYAYRGIEITGVTWQYTLQNIRVSLCSNRGFFINNVAYGLSMKQCYADQCGFYIRDNREISLENCTVGDSNIAFEIVNSRGVLKNLHAESCSPEIYQAIYTISGGRLTIIGSETELSSSSSDECFLWKFSDSANITLIQCYNTNEGNFTGNNDYALQIASNSKVRFFDCHITKPTNMSGLLHDMVNGVKYSIEIDIFMDALAASANAVHAAITGTGAEQEITTAITNPDVPRNISITNSANSTGDVKIDGVNAKGISVSDTIAIVTGGIAYGVVAFATVSKITVPAGVANPDTISVGFSDKLGLSNIIYASGDVYKVKVNNADDPTIGTVNTTYDTVDCATINAADDITIWYKSNLNLIS